MGPDPVLGPVVDRAQVQVDALDGAEVAFDAGQTLVGGHHLARVHLLGADGGADDVQPVQGRLGACWCRRTTRSSGSICLITSRWLWSPTMIRRFWRGGRSAVGLDLALALALALDWAGE